MARRWLFLVTSSLGPLVLLVVAYEVRLSRLADSGTPSGEAQAAMVFLDHTERLHDRSGAVTWAFEAERVEVLGSGDYLVTNLRHGQYYRNGISELHLRADRARMEAHTRNMVATGRIRVLSDRGLTVEAETAYWFEADGKMFIPEVGTCQWQDPAQPDTPPAAIKTKRFYFWPAKTQMDLPDALTATAGSDTVQAAGGSALLDKGELQLVGPATINADVPRGVAEGNLTGPKTRVVASVGEGGRMVYDRRTGAARMNGATTVELPTDQMRLACDNAFYSGRATRTVDAGGNVALSDPGDVLHGARVQVDTTAQRAEFGGPVDLQRRGPQGLVTLAAPRLTYWYRDQHRRVEAGGGVKLTASEADVACDALSADLEGEEARCVGHVALTSHSAEGPVTLAAPRLTYWYRDKRRRAEASGGVKLGTDEANVDCDRLTADLEAEEARCTGHVVMITKPKDVAAADADEVAKARARPVEVRSERLWHRFAAGRGLTEATGAPRFHQGDRDGRADRLRYDHETEVVELDGNVELTDKDGERARCGHLTYDVRHDELKVEHPKRAEFLLKGEA
jgi:lipopolysaccharide export system protein LptA